jgi:hypothetical protein
VLLAPALTLAHADQSTTPMQDIRLFVGDSLVISSSQNSIQQVFLQGNLTVANLTKTEQYPANHFELTARRPGAYQLKVLFDFPTDYRIDLYVRTADQRATKNSTSYYLSGGSFEMNLNAVFSDHPKNTLVATPSESPSQSLLDWIGKFGQAFPLWVKLLYFAFGIQFFTIGGLWIRRAATRRESTAQRFDAGDQAFLWLDIAYKFLLVSFAAIVAVMGGELLILFILRFMFLVSLDLLSLWDLFVIGFAAGAVIIIYLVRFAFEKLFDMKPMEED